MPLLEAIEAGDLGRVRALIAAGADLREEDEVGCFTALGLAACLGHVEIVRVLLDAGVSPDDRAHASALDGAALGGHVEAACLLLATGASIDLAGETGLTPLMNAARVGHLAMVRFLAEAGADLHRRDCVSRWVGRTALDLAVEGGYPDVVEELLGQGARFEGGDFLQMSGWFPRSPDELIELARRHRLEREARGEGDETAQLGEARALAPDEPARSWPVASHLAWSDLSNVRIRCAGDSGGGLMGLDTVELVMAVEEEFGIAIPNEIASTLERLGDLHRFAVAALRGRGEAVDPDAAWDRIKAVVKRDFAIREKDLVPEARLVHDLGLD